MNEEEARDLARTDPARAALWFLRRGALVVYDSPVLVRVNCWCHHQFPLCSECKGNGWDSEIPHYSDDENENQGPCNWCRGTGWENGKDPHPIPIHATLNSCVRRSADSLRKVKKEISSLSFRFQSTRYWPRVDTPPLDIAIAEEMARRVATAREAMVAKAIGLPTFICEKCGQWTRVSNPWTTTPPLCEFCV